MAFDALDTRRHVLQGDLGFRFGVLFALQMLAGRLQHRQHAGHHLFQPFQQRIRQFTGLRQLPDPFGLRLLALDLQLSQPALPRRLGHHRQIAADAVLVSLETHGPVGVPLLHLVREGIPLRLHRSGCGGRPRVEFLPLLSMILLCRVAAGAQLAGDPRPTGGKIRHRTAQGVVQGENARGAQVNGSAHSLFGSFSGGFPDHS